MMETKTLLWRWKINEIGMNKGTPLCIATRPNEGKIAYMMVHERCDECKKAFELNQDVVVGFSFADGECQTVALCLSCATFWDDKDADILGAKPRVRVKKV